VLYYHILRVLRPDFLVRPDRHDRSRTSDRTD
jgi:hypothetical protein